MDNSYEIIDERVSSTFQTFSLGDLACATVKHDDIAKKADAQKGACAFQGQWKHSK